MWCNNRDVIIVWYTWSWFPRLTILIYFTSRKARRHAARVGDIPSSSVTDTEITSLEQADQQRLHLFLNRIFVVQLYIYALDVAVFIFLCVLSVRRMANRHTSRYLYLLCAHRENISISFPAFTLYVIWHNRYAGVKRRASTYFLETQRSLSQRYYGCNCISYQRTHAGDCANSPDCRSRIILFFFLMIFKYRVANLFRGSLYAHAFLNLQMTVLCTKSQTELCPLVNSVVNYADRPRRPLNRHDRRFVKIACDRQSRY